MALRGKVIIAAVAAVVVVGLVLYGMQPRSGKETTTAAANCAQTEGLATKLEPLARGDLAALAIDSKPKPLPELSFSGPEGKSMTLADFHGRNILLNLWATWCVPCRQEMPELDKLQGDLGGQGFEVVAVNIDTSKLDRPKAFLSEIGVKNLNFYADNKADIFQVLKRDGKALGLPTTLLVGKDGCEIGMMSGPAKWDSNDAQALIKAIKG
jgi:thiol-disulfide isomerase/thioredoxin